MEFHSPCLQSEPLALPCGANRRPRKASRPRRPALVIGLALWSAAGAIFAQGDAASPPQAVPEHPAVDYTIIITGGELLAGAIQDGHTQFLTQTLRPLGLHCVGSMCVDDRPDDIQAALRFAATKAHLVIVTGGLGPTDNDVTRQSLATFTGVPLQEHPDVLADMERRFRTPRDQLRSNLRRQTQVPVRGTYLKNSGGTAVGLVFEGESAVVVALPGPPRELQPMVQQELIPYLSRRYGTHLPGCSLTVRFLGLGQSQVDQTIDEHIPLPPDVTTSSQFEAGRVDFTFSLPHDQPEDRARLEELRQGFRQHLGDYLYAEDETTLEQRIVQLLQQRHLQLALAEAGSSGSLAAGLGTAQGVRDVLAGGYVAPGEERLCQLLGVPLEAYQREPTASARLGLLAAKAATATASPWGVAVGEVRTDDRGAFVEMVLWQRDVPLESHRISVRGGGEIDQLRLETQLLEQLWRKLKAGP